MSRTVFIDGEAGTTGLQIRDRLRGLDGVSVTSLGEARRRDREARRAAMEAADLVVLCLPDEAAREAAEWVEGMGSAAPRLLDASTAHRTAPGWVYGFPELAAGQAKAVAVAPRVANPGCYATGAIALIRPEAVALAPETQAGALAGTVIASTFLGAVSRVTVDLGDTTIMAQLSTADAIAHPAGSRVSLTVRPDPVLVAARERAESAE